ncbi:GNAT family N-acetyltransferase [Bacillus infantis]|uniref:GNAT family N-acetyltransferase n=1 Tax=Bacillus infantis TaxID=324767 RepID=UPI00101C1BC5|nr:GNAT family N-acetyltransferase [Bacillus infantis]RYI26997.1 GNAT family N-acetyltransferase [Bacillus infantis]
MRMTDRLKRIIHLAEGERKETGCQLIQPEHLLSGCLLERTGAFAEMAQKCELDISGIRMAAAKKTEGKGSFRGGFPTQISEETKVVMEAAAGFMKKYGQIILNEGHLLKALLSCDSLAELAGEKNKQQMLAIGAAARDLAVHLASYSPPDKLYTTVRRAGKKNREMLAEFTEDNFSAEWAQTAEAGMKQEEPPVYIAFSGDGELIGFAAFDSYKGKKGYFGPMGVAKGIREKGTGSALLHACLMNMKEIGYEYAIIGGAGPIEFYEKVCRAVVIPYPD